MDNVIDNNELMTINNIKNKEKKEKKIKTKKQVRNVSEAERAKRAERMVGINKKRADKEGQMTQAVERVTTKWNYADIKELSEITGLSIANTKSLLFDKKKLKDWKNQKQRKINITGMVVLEKLIRTVNDGRLGAYQGGVMFNMLAGQFLGKKDKKPDNVINIGDNRQVKVYYPNFDKNSEENVESGEIIANKPLKDL